VVERRRRNVLRLRRAVGGTHAGGTLYEWFSASCPRLSRASTSYLETVKDVDGRA
jgi:hypothetical protein